MKNKKGLVLLACVLAVFQGACGAKKMASNITSQIFSNGAPAMEMQEDLEIAEASMLPMLNMLEVFQADNPKNADLNILLARSYGNFAFAFLEEKVLAASGNTESVAYQTAYTRASRFYEKGLDYGLLALRKNSAVSRALGKDVDSFKRALKGFGKADVPAMYWTAFNWASWINLHKDSPKAVGDLPKAVALMERALALDPDYYYGGIHQFFGAYYASRPTILGGDVKKAKASFDQAIEASQGKFLFAKVLFAQYYAVAVQDRALFESVLREVIAADPAQLPEQRLANEVAHVRAKTLLLQAAKWF